LNPFSEHILDNPYNKIKHPLTDIELQLKLSYSKIGLINFELDEEDRERDAMRLLVFRNKELLAYMFKKYSSLGTLNRKKGTVDVLTERTITLGEI
jgi:hypothetical protein